MPADTTVKFLHSAMTGAPSVTGAAGTVIAMLDACLVNGFGTGNVDSIVVANNVATVTRSAGHPMEVGSVALIAGATPAGLNGEKKVLTVSTTTYTFEATGISNQTATGTITHKLAPLGWEKPFSGTDLAAYRSLNILSTRDYLRVDDTAPSGAGSGAARVVAYESMADINSGTGPFPTSAQMSGGGWWLRYRNSQESAKEWVLVGDDRTFYLWLTYRTDSSQYGLYYGFGDLIPVKTSDPYCAFITSAQGMSDFTSLSHPDSSLSWSQNNNAAYMWTARAATGIGGSSAARKVAPILGGSNVSTRSGSSGLVYPNTGDNGLYFAPFYLLDNSPYSLRGKFPGLYYIDATVSGVFPNRSYITGINGLPGKTFRVVYNNSDTTVAYDITGPWR